MKTSREPLVLVAERTGRPEADDELRQAVLVVERLPVEGRSVTAGS